MGRHLTENIPFTEFPTTPSSAPTDNYHVANKKYVDDNSGSGAQSKLDATTAPTINDDSGDGYSISSIWIDVTNDLIYQCADATLGAAVWKNLSSVIVNDAPSDGTTYGRKDGTWAVIIVSGISGLLDCLLNDVSPIDIQPSLPTITYDWS